MNSMYKGFVRIFSLIIIDMLAITICFILAYYTRKSLNVMLPDIVQFNFKLSDFTRFWWCPLIITVLISWEGLYVKRQPLRDEAKDILKAFSFGIIVILSIVTLGKMSGEFSRLMAVFFWGYGLMILPFFRFFGKRFLYHNGIWKESVIILGAGTTGIAAANGISEKKFLGYHIAGFLDDDPEKTGSEIKIGGESYKVLGKIDDHKKFIRLLNVSTIIIAMPSMAGDRLSGLTNCVQRVARQVLVVPDLKGIALLNTEICTLFMQQIFFLRIKNNLHSGFNRLVKIIFDFGLTIAALPIILPAFAAIGLMIKISSPGPVLYSHARIGRNGMPFKVYKFRSMYLDADERLKSLLESDERLRHEWETYFKLKDDPRVTGIGRFLRRTSLDELPQILNVLKGEMSLVGPRPVLQEEIDNYYKEYADYYYEVKPGITGLWQVSGRNDIGYDFRVKLDSFYVLNWSLWFDIVILLKTVKIVLNGNGAY